MQTPCKTASLRADVRTLRILAYLAVAGPCSKDAVSSMLGINPTSLPRYLSAVVKSGHLAKSVSPVDARAVILSLSPHGRELVSSLCLHFEDFVIRTS